MTPPSRLRLRLSSPAEWKTLSGDGFVVHVDPRRQSPLAFALSVAAGLDSRPRRLDASYLYDAAGSSLFERITLQPEYYLTRVEDRMLAADAPAIRAVAGPGALVELGSGLSTKTRRLLDAWTTAAATAPAWYVPVDVDARALEQACGTLRGLYPALCIEGVAATYDRALAVLGGCSPMTVAFLGSSLGNLGWREYPEFCEMVASVMASGDHFLVGLDLVKNPAEIEAAYNDAAGVTAAFTRNLFARMNRELGTDISGDDIDHVAFYDVERERVEIFAEARRELHLRVSSLGRELRIARGERILTEVSHKFRPEAAVAAVERFGFRLAWKDVGDGRFGLFLFERIASPAGRAERPRQDHLAGLALLAEMRTRTLQIVAPLREEDLRRQHSPLMSPVAWDLGHIAHFEEQWLLGPAEHLLSSEVESASPDWVPDRVYDPLATPRAHRAELVLPSVVAVRRRMYEVRQRVEEMMTSQLPSQIPGSLSPVVSPTSVSSTASGRGRGGPGSGLSPGFALQLVAQHEAQHQETILQAVALREDLDYRPAFVVDTPVTNGVNAAGQSVLIPGGPFMMGTNDRARAYDNERPAHPVDVPTFKLDREPVSNAAYLAFMTDAGYSRRALWTDAGWSWLQETRVRAPLHWRSTGHHPRDGARGWQALVFGRLVPLIPDSPVVHVSFHEASAYACWAGARLPTEPEWEKAAAWDPARGTSRPVPWGDAPWDPSRANLDQRRLEPLPAGASSEGRSAYGCLQMLGDVWEWTDTCFDGYPGFESFPYREYSEIFFGQTYRVLRGGSFATRVEIARTTFRNWDLPERRQIFAGFRCARSV